jgi:tetratricopeptide (TPR) repeat protein
VRALLEPAPDPVAAPALLVDASGTALALPPVARAEIELATALAALDRADVGRGNQALQRALEAVHWEAPFVLDVFDRLLRAGQVPSARLLVDDPAWPRDRAAGRAAAARLLLAEGKVEVALPLLVDAWSKDGRDPALGTAYAAALRERPGAVPPSSVLIELAAHWPTRLDLQLAASQALAAEGDLPGASLRLLGQIQALEGASPEIGAGADTLLARYYLQTGDRAQGTKYLRRALRLLPTAVDALALRDAIAAEEGAQRPRKPPRRPGRAREHPSRRQ